VTSGHFPVPYTTVIVLPGSASPDGLALTTASPGGWCVPTTVNPSPCSSFRAWPKFMPITSGIVTRAGVLEAGVLEAGVPEAGVPEAGAPAVGPAAGVPAGEEGEEAAREPEREFAGEPEREFAGEEARDAEGKAGLEVGGTAEPGDDGAAEPGLGAGAEVAGVCAAAAWLAGAGVPLPAARTGALGEPLSCHAVIDPASSAIAAPPMA
jgi:hypothetical protein